jgi:PAS domain S-box-containing protein
MFSIKRRTKLAFVLGTISALTFMISQIFIYLDVIHFTYNIPLFNIMLFVFYAPSSAIFGWDMYIKYKDENQKINDKLKAINNSNIVVVYDSKGNIVKANNNFCKAVGYTHEELVGLHHMLFVPNNVVKSKEYRDFWKQLRAGSNIKQKFKRVKKNGDLIWLYGSYNPIKSGSGAVYQVINVGNDVTGEHNAQLELRNKNTYLEHAAKILRHDMHSGINTYIPRGIKSLERRIKPEQIKELKIETPLKLIKDGLDHAQRVYRGVFEFTNLVKENAVLEKGEYDLGNILKDYLRKTAYSDQIIIDDLPTMLVNEALFCTGIDNLIRNGLKYNDSKTKFIKIKMIDEKHLAVIDNGRGMSQKDFDELSQPYQRKEGQKEKGTGLGLNISVAIFKEHGFQMFVEKLEVGTMIKVKIR